MEELELQLPRDGCKPVVTRPLAGMPGGFQRDTEGLLLDLPPKPLERCIFVLPLTLWCAN